MDESMDGRVSDKAFCHQPENVFLRAEFTNLKRLRLESRLCHRVTGRPEARLFFLSQFPHLHNEADNTFVENGKESLR